MVPPARRTLYDCIRPIRVTLALFGFDVAPEMVPRFIRLTGQSLLFLTLPPTVYLLINFAHDRLRPERRQTSNEFVATVSQASLLLTAIFYWSSWSRRTTLRKVMKSLRQFPLGQNDAKRIPALFLITMALFYADFYVRDFDWAYVSYSPSVPFYWVLLPVVGSFLIVFISNFNAPMLFLGSALALYASSGVEMAVEGVKGSRSPWRRARMMSGMIRDYEKVRQVLVEADPIFSWNFFALKIVSLIYFCIFITSGLFLKEMYHKKEIMRVLTKALVATNFPILVYYLHLTFRANNVDLLIFKCAAWCELHEVGRNDAMHLFKMKMEVLAHLAHSRFHLGPFTLAGEPIVKDLFYSMVLDWIDTNSLLGGRAIALY